jgi:DNA-binding transcriptional MerR regulator
MEREAMDHTVGQVSELADVSVRTLHHYDQVGLLKPGGRTESGYRLYSAADLERLQQILLYRELGFRLEEIVTILDEPGTDAEEHLRRQRVLLLERVSRLQLMVSAIDREMEARTMGIELTPEERFEVWGDFNPDEYQEEVQERWGETDAYKESQRRTSRYTKEDWLTIGAQSEEINKRLVEAMDQGLAPDSSTPMDLAEEHRQHITRWFYDCGYDVHVGLSEMYVGDPRFKANYDKLRDGLAEYLHAAIAANAARAERS